VANYTFVRYGLSRRDPNSRRKKFEAKNGFAVIAAHSEDAGFHDLVKHAAVSTHGAGWSLQGYVPIGDLTETQVSSFQSQAALAQKLADKYGSVYAVFQTTEGLFMNRQRNMVPEGTEVFAAFKPKEKDRPMCKQCGGQTVKKAGDICGSCKSFNRRGR
jgi:hypothetical protein